MFRQQREFGQAAEGNKEERCQEHHGDANLQQAKPAISLLPTWCNHIEKVNQ